MPEHQADSRALNFAGDIDELGRPLPMSVEALRARTEKWPTPERTPADVAAMLARSRQMFVDGYYTYGNFMDAATRSLQAVEAALRVRLDAGSRPTFDRLIEQAKVRRLIGDDAREILHVGRRLRNIQIHETVMSVITPAMAAGLIETSHRLAAELFETEPWR